MSQNTAAPLVAEAASLIKKQTPALRSQIQEFRIRYSPSVQPETLNLPERHAAHTPRKRWRCGSACAARATSEFFWLLAPCIVVLKIISSIFLPRFFDLTDEPSNSITLFARDFR
jgi:hypothetical protein